MKGFNFLTLEGGIYAKFISYSAKDFGILNKFHSLFFLLENEACVHDTGQLVSGQSEV